MNMSKIKHQKYLLVWDAVSMAWTEIGMDEKDYLDTADKFHKEFNSWQEIQKITFDVIGAFSFGYGCINLLIILGFIYKSTFALLLLSFIPYFFMMSLPDWGYSEEYLTEKMNNWYQQHYIIKFLNPIRVLGYPLILLFTFGHLRRLKKYYVNHN